EADAGAADAEPREQRLAEALAFAAIDRRKRRRRPIVEHVRLVDAEARLQERREPARHAQVRFDSSRIAALEPARDAHRGMPPPEPELQQREPEVVPVDDEPYALSSEREPRDGKRGERGRILREDEVRRLQLLQRAPEP